ncbi:uncharacterized protein EV420DRAFT_1652151 [Desarmillaria tabescens]|uniref:Uncharacterized protein n=1 Tax=Armillaria tabescens TaxID=1929756 RepID=A0AA39J6Y4_ARMTA|nr:uncharacterized protein EV420DRAFT_1652151 [Desarmillaria tabescens]KAK0437256.1 hypothetical protein EV420DRAFT_1652151 [Desarmillaria tabescens]
MPRCFKDKPCNKNILATGILSSAYNIQGIISHPKISLPQMPTQSRHSALFPCANLQDLWYLEGVEKRLARRFGMNSDQGIDSEVVLQEATKRAASEGYVRGVSLEVIGMPTSKKDVNDLIKLDSIRRDHATRIAGDSGRVSQLPTAATPHRTSQFWAVLIGINAYKSNPLQGCVSDALLMKNEAIVSIRYKNSL